MRPILVSFGILAPALGSLVQKRACAADSCALAVTGSDGAPDVTSRLADCSSFMLTTVTPVSYTTTTYTFTFNPPPIILPSITRRQAPAPRTALPTYATACPSPAAYSSACSCWGIPPTTTTAPAITSTETPYTIVDAAPTTLDFRCSRAGACGSFEPHACPGVAGGVFGSFGSCVCGRALDGYAVCVTVAADSACTTLQRCSADSPCLDLEMVCVVDTCCEAEGVTETVGRCVDGAPNQCLNPAARLRVRAAGSAGDAELPCGAFRKC